MKILLIFGAVCSVRLTKRGGSGVKVLASTTILGLGMGILAHPPQQGAEQAEENRDKTGGESGDPPSG
jgi:hypothetical protein